jgi:hypothetical protein
MNHKHEDYNNDYNRGGDSRDLEQSYITNGQTCNADLRRLRPLPGQ